tara:strand:- start:17400 stop:17609 length:210 start_codon:yes stop_codon:yes gene_type:complete
MQMVALVDWRYDKSPGRTLVEKVRTRWLGFRRIVSCGALLLLCVVSGVDEDARQGTASESDEQGRDEGE